MMIHHHVSVSEGNLNRIASFFVVPEQTTEMSEQGFLILATQFPHLYTWLRQREIITLLRVTIPGTVHDG